MTADGEPCMGRSTGPDLPGIRYEFVVRLLPVSPHPPPFPRFRVSQATDMKNMITQKGQDAELFVEC
jgi:hypothetical protein